jgi:hypothetical protein
LDKTGIKASKSGKMLGMGFWVSELLDWRLQLRPESPILIHEFAIRFGEGIG